MDLQSGFERPDAYRGGVVSIGNFDGVHRGHQVMARTVALRARELGVPSVIMTFDPHPTVLLAPDRTPPQLTTIHKRAELLDRCGIDCVIAYPTDRNLLQLEPEEFFQLIIRDELEARALIEGPNFHFGHRRAGTIDTLRTLCSQHNMRLQILDPVADDTGWMVSSTDIRKAIAEGRLPDAADLLGRPYSVSGVVGSGAQRGRHLGFPTANLENITVMLPPDGVYAGRVELADGPRLAATHIGPNVTFGELAKKVEVHLLDFAGDLYGKVLEVTFLERVRGTQKFDGVDALRRQMELDIARVREIAG
ncbi:Riboflavin kinase [Caulifigura coniformis]|uniref:Riboflavin biosynthesis protein n=1 Tax=Caulifigura coniformis TaxID=2527983 RepID=A0A517SA33_9PLAN|nr:bifunctional riboflavin kinase/FAD synthetase [Caulifigura coniformis]QDT52978.1 Riboflavin kinase [Caulifigura coniformis]